MLSYTFSVILTEKPSETAIIQIFRLYNNLTITREHDVWVAIFDTQGASRDLVVKAALANLSAHGISYTRAIDGDIGFMAQLPELDAILEKILPTIKETPQNEAR